MLDTSYLLPYVRNVGEEVRNFLLDLRRQSDSLVKNHEYKYAKSKIRKLYMMKKYRRKLFLKVFFSCNTLMLSDNIYWERDGASLPSGSTINYGVLHIPNVTVNDEGT